jgi:pimeloyl-ACP methyl ester carboxylesterase
MPFRVIALAIVLAACGRPLVRPSAFDWGQTLEVRTAQIREGTLLYAVTGEGPPLLLLHGFGGQSWVWEKQVSALSGRYRLHLLDLLGYGFSDRPKLDYTPVLFVESVRQFMDRLGIRRASLIGNSMGGGVAWSFALAFPDRVDKLVLIDSVTPDALSEVRNPSFRWFLAIRNLPLVPRLAVALTTRGMLRATLREMVFDDRLITDAVVERQYQIGRIEGTGRVMTSTARHADEIARSAGALAALRRPTLVIWGEHDEVFPLEVGRRLHALIEGSEFRVIPDSGHMPMWERPDETNRAILEFLGR